MASHLGIDEPEDFQGVINDPPEGPNEQAGKEADHDSRPDVFEKGVGEWAPQ